MSVSRAFWRVRAWFRAAIDRVLDGFESVWESVDGGFWRLRDGFRAAIDAVLDGFESVGGVAKIVSVIAVVVVVVVALRYSASGEGPSPFPQPAPILRSPVSLPPGVPIPGPTSGPDE